MDAKDTNNDVIPNFELRERLNESLNNFYQRDVSVACTVHVC